MNTEKMAAMLKEQIDTNPLIADEIEKTSDVEGFRHEYKMTVYPKAGDAFIVSAKDESEHKKQSTRLRLYQCACDPKEARKAGRTNKIRCASDKMEIGCAICGELFQLQGHEI